MALAALGYALFLRLGADWTYFDMLPTLLLVGVAFALTFGTLMIVATDGIDEHEQGLAGGLQYVSLQFGAAVGPGDRRRRQRRGHRRDARAKPCSTATAPRCWSRWRWPRSRWP